MTDDPMMCKAPVGPPRMVALDRPRDLPLGSRSRCRAPRFQVILCSRRLHFVFKAPIAVSTSHAYGTFCERCGHDDGNGVPTAAHFDTQICRYVDVVLLRLAQQPYPASFLCPVLSLRTALLRSSPSTRTTSWMARAVRITLM